MAPATKPETEPKETEKEEEDMSSTHKNNTFFWGAGALNQGRAQQN